jgi:hypothetical protein
MIADNSRSDPAIAAMMRVLASIATTPFAGHAQVVMLGLYPTRHSFDRRDVCPQPYKLGHKLAVTQQALMLWIVVLKQWQRHTKLRGHALDRATRPDWRT